LPPETGLNTLTVRPKSAPHACRRAAHPRTRP
jgi:hypothetical protein